MDAPSRPYTLAESRSYCARLTRTHYENFSAASLLLPRRLLPHVHAIYAYCRTADDMADESGSDSRALELLDWWREELRLCYTGRPRHPVMVALRPTIERFRIPVTPFLDLLTAFEQDQRVKRYRTFDELLGYCRNSANPVGHLVLYLFECFDAERAALSDAICTGLQLANFWQDVARDHDIGRIYLPEDERRRFGVSEDDIALRRCTPGFVELMHYEVARTRQWFHDGDRLFALLPKEIAADIELFQRGGLAILRKIEDCGYNVLARRPVLSKWDKSILLARSLWQRMLADTP